MKDGAVDWRIHASPGLRGVIAVDKFSRVFLMSTLLQASKFNNSMVYNNVDPVSKYMHVWWIINRPMIKAGHFRSNIILNNCGWFT